MGYTTASGVTVRQEGIYGPTIYIGSDGRQYPSMASAENASKLFSQAASGGGGSIGKSGGGKSLSTKKTTKGSGDSGAADEFLKKWGQISNQALATMQSSIDKFNATGEAANDQINNLLAQINQQSTAFSEKYGGLEEDALTAAREDLRNKRELTGRFMDLSREDEGVAGRAAADARAASDRAMGMETRQAMSYGVDPTSGKFGAMTRKGSVSRARNEVLAMNNARNMERDRVSGMVERGLSLVDPSASYKIAGDISERKKGFTTTQAGLVTTGANLQSDLAKAAAGVAGSVAGIGKDYGSAGLTLKGINEGASGVEAGSTINAEGAMPSTYDNLYGGRSTMSGPAIKLGGPSSPSAVVPSGVELSDRDKRLLPGYGKSEAFVNAGGGTI